MRELSLFSGAGGGVLASKLLGWNTVGYVEWEDYPQRVLRQRMLDGFIDTAPIYGDIRTFISQGYARRYRGLVDVVSGGFPCQPFSVAGKGLAEDDPRNMWPATRDVIDIIRPGRILLENVPGLLAHEYTKQIFGELAEIGYDATWRCLSAADTGAPHKRERLWIMAYPSVQRSQGWRDELQQQGGQPEICCNKISHASSIRSPGQGGAKKQVDKKATADREIYRTLHDCRWPAEPGMGRVANGVANRVDRLKAIGNGQVPRVAAAAWTILNEN